MKIPHNYKIRLAGFAVALGLLAGCATQSKTPKTGYYFFPAPPDEPRLQYLTSFSTQKEFHGGDENSFLNYVTGKRMPDNGFGKPYGAVTFGHKLYVCDTELGSVVIADFTKRHMSMLPAEGESALNSPLNITADADGFLYVADSGRNQILIFDNNQNYVAAIGKLNEFMPRDVAVSRDRIYVADLKGHTIRAYDKATRTELFTFPHGQDATNEEVVLQTPTNLALDSRGRVYVADTGHFRVKIFDADGNFLHSVGEFGNGLGQFSRLKGIALDHDNLLYTVDAMSQVIQIFNDDGRMLTFFGEPMTGKEFQGLPAKVVVDYEDVSYFKQYAAPGFKIEYLVFVINQFGSHKVNVFGFGSKH